MQLNIDQASIEAAIKAHLDETVARGIDYKVKEAINRAIADAITPEIVQSYVDSAMSALTDPDVSLRIVSEMQHAMAEAVRVTMEETVLAVAVRLRGYSTSRDRDAEAKIDALRERLFPSLPNNAISETCTNEPQA